MKALSIKQPWAWLIVHGGKTIENRTWNTSFRGRFFVHASKQFDRSAYEYMMKSDLWFKRLPRLSDFQFGGIIGSVELVGVIEPGQDAKEDTPWYEGGDRYGFVLRNPEPLPFQPLRGQLNFFDVESEV